MTIKAQAPETTQSFFFFLTLLLSQSNPNRKILKKGPRQDKVKAINHGDAKQGCSTRPRDRPASQLASVSVN
jgi:hypothetical protein